jgi:hypothetical protein
MKCGWAAKGTVWRPVAALQQTSRFVPSTAAPNISQRRSTAKLQCSCTPYNLLNCSLDSWQRYEVHP